MPEKKSVQGNPYKLVVGKQTPAMQINDTNKTMEQEANKIIAKAYEQSANIVHQACQKAEQIIADTQRQTDSLSSRIIGENERTYIELGNIMKPGSFSEHSYERIDYLFLQLRHYLTNISTSTQSNTIREMKTLLTELEYWTDSLVIDSLKLKNVEKLIQRTRELATKLREKLESTEQSRLT